MEIWEVIYPGTNVKRSPDRQAMGALMRSVPKEMWGTLGVKKTVKEAWETVQTMRVQADQVKEESIEAFGMWITNLIANLKSLGETVDDPRVVKKFIHVAPPRFNHIVVSIEMFCDVKTLSVEDAVGRLRVVKDRLVDKVEQITNKVTRLLLAKEEDWLEKYKHRFQSNQKEGGSSDGG
ncbi:unnamed protein product [Miscanthus lutarioriparius]|uniref:Uncharacterized protein n=1 Tax=Miscanthus lutarioriparius TaxID=422564 RepID=A0A811SFI7_9POAL|nr:unnamed protein product [Miscanthus lutarioriparius]